MRLAHVRKAAIAGAVAGLGALGTGMLDGWLADTEIVASIGAGLVAMAATWAVPNKQQPRGDCSHPGADPA